MKNQKCTIFLIIVNVIIFFSLSFIGMTEDPEFMLGHGAMYVPEMIAKEEYHQLFTSMFLHFDLNHLINNMVMLAVMGGNLEQIMGKIKYLIIYFASGLLGNVLSAYGDLMSGQFAVSAGASGAVFGIVGALLFVALRNKGQIGDISGRGLLFMIVLSLYYGFTTTGVDNLAHIGGLAAGFVLSILLYRKRKRNRKRSVSMEY